MLPATDLSSDQHTTIAGVGGDPIAADLVHLESLSRCVRQYNRSVIDVNEINPSVRQLGCDPHSATVGTPREGDSPPVNHLLQALFGRPG
jgi:hypothetical protein